MESEIQPDAPVEKHPIMVLRGLQSVIRSFPCKRSQGQHSAVYEATIDDRETALRVIRVALRGIATERHSVTGGCAWSDSRFRTIIVLNGSRLKIDIYRSEVIFNAARELINDTYPRKAS